MCQHPIGRGAAPSPPTPTPPALPAKAGTYPLAARPLPRHSCVGRNPVGAQAPQTGRSPVSMDPHAPRHSRESGNLPPVAAPRPQCSNGAHLALKSAHSALTERSFGAHKALKRRSKSAHCPRTAQTASQAPPAPLDPTLENLNRPPRANPFPRLPQASRAIMTQPHCVPLRPLLSWTPIERPGRPVRGEE